MRYTPDFKIRRRGLRTFFKTLGDGRRTHGLMAQYDLAVRAGKALQHAAAEARLALDFSEGRRCRIEGETLVLLVDNAVQHNRLKNMRTRLLAAIMTKGLPITNIKIRLRAPKPAEAEPRPAEPDPVCRRPSIAGAAALRRAASEAVAKDMREALAALASLVGPTAEEAPIVLQTTISEEGKRIAAGLQSVEELLPRLPQAPDERLIPSEADAEKDAALAAVRERMLARLNVRRSCEAPLAQARSTLKALAARIALIAEEFFSEEPDHAEIESVYLEVRKAASAELARIAKTAGRLRELERRRAEEEAAKAAQSSARLQTAAAEQNDAGEAKTETDADKAARIAARLEALVNDVKALEKFVKSIRKTLLSAVERLQAIPKGCATARIASELEEEAMPIERGLANRLAAAERALEFLHAQNKRLKSALGRPLKPESLAAVEGIEHALPNLRTQIRILDDEVDTLAERVEVLENDFCGDEQASRQDLEDADAGRPQTPEELALEAQAARLERLLGSLSPASDIRLVPDESSAARDPAIAALRLRLLAKQDARRRVNDLAAGASSLLQALRQAKESGIGIDREMLQAASCAVDETEAAAAGLFAAHEAPPNDIPEAPASVKESSAAESEDDDDGRAAGSNSDSRRREALDEEIRSRLARAAGEAEASFAQSLLADPNAVPASELLAAIDAAIKKLAALPSKLPKAPDEKLIPSEEDAMFRPMLASLRARMLARRRRRGAFEREILRLRKELAETAEALADPLADGGARRLQAVKALAQAGAVEEMLDEKA